jgi:hypothetical protein
MYAENPPDSVERGNIAIHLAVASILSPSAAFVCLQGCAGAHRYHISGVGEYRIRHERVRSTLLPESRHWPVSGHEGRIWTKWPEPTPDRIYQHLVIAFWKISAPDRPLEEHVANNRKPAFSVMKDNVAGRVPRAMIDVERQFADCHAVAVVEPAIGREWLGAGDAVLRADSRRHVDPELVFGMRPFDWQAPVARQDARKAAMIDMTVRNEELLNCNPVLARCRFQPVEVAARIDERTAHRLRAPQQRTVLLERRNRNDRRCKRSWDRIHTITDAASRACLSTT